jgi:putative transposase
LRGRTLFAMCLHSQRRRSIRLPGYDYSQNGAYFITICTQDRECLFGDIENGEMRMNERGRIAAETWEWLALQYDHVVLDEWMIMPNHLHGIIVIADECRGGSRTAPAVNQG